MDRLDQAKQIIEKCSNNSNKCWLSWGCVFFDNPITHMLETRIIYSEDTIEISLWADFISQPYRDNNIPFAVYINHTLTESKHFNKLFQVDATSPNQIHQFGV